ncbi:MAG TPA: hypothetical protein VFJ01_02460 [Oleiagrimonas sp.]|nr:hypothetical protein [Oleiagrimonas sp.]
MKTFNKKWLSPALLLTLMPAMFTFGSDGVSWFWSGKWVVPIMLLSAATVFWALAFMSGRKHLRFRT